MRRTLDAGLACHLLGIRSADELRHHPLRGAIFESGVAGEIYKHHTHRGQQVTLHHYCEIRGAETDMVLQSGNRLIACEAKSGATLHSPFLNHLRRYPERTQSLSPWPEVDLRLVYGGDTRQRRLDVECLGWRPVHEMAWD